MRQIIGQNQVTFGTGEDKINTSSDEQFFAENQAKDVQDEQELPGQRTHHN